MCDDITGGTTSKEDTPPLTLNAIDSAKHTDQILSQSNFNTTLHGTASTFLLCNGLLMCTCIPGHWLNTVTTEGGGGNALWGTQASEPFLKQQQFSG